MPGYSDLWRAIIRPPRAEYKNRDLGPKRFCINNGGIFKVQRTDFKLTNARGSEIVCSHFEPSDDIREYKELPCCIYMHGNSSCRLEALECI